MVKNIKIGQYRKLKKIDLKFDKGINSISGTNGTCKTSILHLISNSCQAVIKKCSWIKDDRCLKVLNAINAVTNPKVERLTKGDKRYNDPAHGVSGTLYSVEYFDNEPLNFRKHNSKIANRYAIKPNYQTGSKDTLPYCPIIYLGLSRLFPFGEYKYDDNITLVKDKLPSIYQDQIAELYKTFTNYSINYSTPQKMGDVKVRTEFNSEIEGIDSNTISAGEDNLTIILTALISLKYYYDSIDSTKTVESILLIDELDATLHPAYQIKLLQVFKEFSDKYKIQIIFTTHSMSLIEVLLENKYNVVYLLDNITNVVCMDEPDIYKIKMHLHSLTQDDIYIDKVIPLFTEDDEARLILEMILEYFTQKYSREFGGVRRFFHLVYAKIGAENLSWIFSDDKLLRMTMKSICVLDGDHKTELAKCIIALPGGDSPEKFLVDYAKKLYDEDDNFWTQSTIVSKGYGKQFYLTRICNEISTFDSKLALDKENGDSTKGKTREFYKKLFNNNITFLKLLFKHWLNNPSNQGEIKKFYDNLHILFKKIAQYHEINPHEWEIDEGSIRKE